MKTLQQPKAGGQARLWLCGVALAATCSLRAQSVINGDFEAPAFSSSAFQYDPDSADATWTFTGATGISSADGPWAPTGGATSQMAFLQLYGTDTASISQSIHFAAAGNFSLTYLVGTRDGYPGIDYSVSLTSDANSTVVFSSTDSTASGQNFTSINYSVSVPSAGNYTLMFEGLPNGDFYNDRSAVFDNVAIAAAIPEPSAAVALLGVIGFGGAIWAARKRRAGQSRV